MYTVKELIEFLQQCPHDYPVLLTADGVTYDIEVVGIDPNEGTVDLFAEE